VLLSAAGTLFCGGGDLEAFTQAGERTGAYIKELTANLHVALSRFARMRAPLVVAVQGVAAGAGFSLACAGDVVLASDKARFTMAYTRVGLVPDGGATYTLPRLVGPKRAMELMLTNRVLSAEEALDWGIVSRVVPHAQLMEQAEALAQELAAGPTGSYAAVKRLLLSAQSESFEAQMELESRAIGEAVVGADGQEGMRAFVDKRAPVFRG
jgi:2-(1,2-epoxy-1,2-dihydrophenyl)acetyl-CoA isomerase